MKKTNKAFEASTTGYYQEFGGAYIPELLYPNIDELRRRYLAILASEKFKQDYRKMLKTYVGRPSPLYYSPFYSQKLEAKVYMKREDLNHTGSHKINNTVGQIILAGELGKKRIIAETGAGQHGVATATVCARYGLPCTIYMGALDVERQSRNVTTMRMLGAEVVPVESGNKTLKDATNEALRHWINEPEDTHYIIGSVVGPHPYPDLVTRLQSVISEELKNQLLEETGSSEPDKIIACVGGGSNAAGIFYHYLNNAKVELIGVEASGLGLDTGYTAASIARGSEGIIHGSKTLLMQTKDGQIIEPYSISAGLDYPGIGPLHALLAKNERARYISVTDEEALTAALTCMKYEGIVPALESAHALAGLEKLETSKEEVIVVNLSGRGEKDFETYKKFINESDR